MQTSCIHYISVGAGRFLEQDVQVFEETMNLNYFGTLRVIKAFLPSMVIRGRGEVVLVSSAAAVCGTMQNCQPLQDAAWCHLRTACHRCHNCNGASSPGLMPPVATAC